MKPEAAPPVQPMPLRVPNPVLADGAGSKFRPVGEDAGGNSYFVAPEIHGCRFITVDQWKYGEKYENCGAAQIPGSAYCAHHHKICYSRTSLKSTFLKKPLPGTLTSSMTRG